MATNIDKSSNDSSLNDVELTLEELYKCRGENKGQILLSVCGRIFDVSSSRHIYGPNEGYSFATGKDITYMLARSSLLESDCNRFDIKLEGHQGSSLIDWIVTYLSKYPLVGKLKGHEACLIVNFNLN